MAVNDSKGMDRNAKLVANSLTKLARSANIFDDAEAETIEELIADYFLVDGEEESPAEDDESAELPSGPRGACNAEFSSESEADEPANISDSDDEPLVQNCQEQPDMLQPDHELGRVKTFKCKCKAEEKKKAPLTTLEQAIPGSPCLSQFSVDEVMARRLNMAEFNEAEKDMIILGALAGFQINRGEMTTGKPSRKRKRQRPRVSYVVDSKNVCRDGFKFLYNISQNKLTACLAHYLKHGVTPREKEWGGRKFNSKAFKPEDIQNTVRFVQTSQKTTRWCCPDASQGLKGAT
ncbi:hypothetical protein BaRGS_00022452 [Batillaria attramentaria]|uniref:Uncharacterized protein n=1 Tax=Batillaria attramentaria TaxID=370345 RepID=A0ABD0KGR4_9CAEN